ncbi:MAG TPA: ABC transporter ATP-binding protein, partial [Nitriliruptoraceae bacterium]|nr:ABC transporter ATP-binding protein [Nitriliruptoraceae bacterium]
MLDVRNIEVVYEDVILVLKGLSLQVPDGEIVALLGPNGAGKTTVLRALTGLLDVHHGEITRGEISFDGETISGRAAHEIVSSGIAQVMEGRRVFAELSVEENLKAGAYTGRGDGAQDRVFDLFPILAERRKSIAGYLSGGEQQMLAIGRALMANPELLLLDEPSLGLAPQLVEQIRDLIVEINEQGTAVLLVEQTATMALSIASHGYVLETGKIVLDKSADELLN